MLFRRIFEPYVTWWALYRTAWHAASMGVVAQSLAIVLGLIASRGLGPESYGKIGAIGAYFGWFGLLISYNVNARLPSLLAENRMHPRRQAQADTTVLVLTLLFTGSGILLALLGLPLALPRLQLTEFGPVALLYAGFFALLQIRVVLDTISQCSGWLHRWAVSNLVAALCPVVLLGGLLLFRGHFSPLQYMLLFLLASVLAILFTFWIFLRAVGGWSCLHIDRTMVRPMLVAGGGPWLSLLSATMVSYGVPLLLARYLAGKEHIAYFNNTIAVVNWIALVGMGVSMPAMAQWSHLAAERRLPELRRELRRSQLATGVIITTVSVLVAIFAAPIVHLLYGPGYETMVPLLRLMIPITAISGFGGWYYIALFSLGHPGGVGMPNLIYAIPTVLFSYLALRFTNLGVNGAILAMDIGIVLWLIAYERMFRRAYRTEMMTAQARVTEEIP